MIKNEITAHAVGTTTLHPDVRTILEIGGQDSKIILRGKRRGGGLRHEHPLRRRHRFLPSSSQAHRLGVEVEEFGRHRPHFHQTPANIAARCTVFAECDLVHKIQMGYSARGHHRRSLQRCGDELPQQRGQGQDASPSPVVFQGGVSAKTLGVVHAFRGASWGCPCLVDQNGHLMGAFGVALLAADAGPITGAESGHVVNGTFDFEAITRRQLQDPGARTATSAPTSARSSASTAATSIIDAWGNRCDKGAVKTTA